MARRVTEVEDDASFAGAAVSDLERRDRHVNGKRIGNERTTGGAKFRFGAKKVVDDCWSGPGRTVILDRLDRQSTAGMPDWPAKFKEVTQKLVRVIVKTAAPFGNVEVRWDRKTKRVGVGAGRILKPGMESNEMQG